ncbi:hypothetical protein ACLK18_03460 [Escherichia coli]
MEVRNVRFCCRDTRHCRSRIAVITDYRDGIKPAHRAKSLPASVVPGRPLGTCQSADCTIVLHATLPRTLAGLLAGGALGLAGRRCKPSPEIHFLPTPALLA